MVERRETARLSDTATNAFAYWWAAFAWLVLIDVDRSAMTLLFGRTPNYDEWTTLFGFLLSLLLTFLLLAVPVLLIWGGWALYNVFRNPCPWETTSVEASARRRIYAGLVCIPIGVGAILVPSYLPALWQRLGFIVCLIVLDLALCVWTRQAKPARVVIRLGKVRDIK